MNLNKVFILGNLTQDPQLRQTTSGQAVCSFGMATNRIYTDAAGQRKEQAEFHNIVAWGRQAELTSQYLQKGRLAMVEGRLQTRSWQDPQGVKHWKTEIVADRIQFGPRPGGGQSGDSDPSSSSFQNRQNAPNRDRQNASPQNPLTDSRNGPPEDATPIIELPPDGEEIDIKDIPF